MNSICRAGIFAAGLSLAMLSGAGAMEANSVVNGDWEITWDDQTATARNLKTGKEVTLFQDSASEEEGNVHQDDSTMLSVVGTSLSWSNSWYAEGGAHPSYGKMLRTVDLEDAKGSLVTLFGEAPVFERLMREPTVRMAIDGMLAEREARPVPENLKQLLERADGGCFAAMGDSLLSEFYFVHRLGGNIAVVQIGLSHGCEVNRGSFTELTRLYFPIPEIRKADFDKAVKDGVLADVPFRKTSFNCARAGTNIEFAICTDPAVAKLDVAMSKRYKAARRTATGDAKAQVKKDQRAWMETRNGECASPTNEMLYDGNSPFYGSIVECLVKSYEARLATLK